ncbi:glycoside hydrolase family 18 protein [Phanerochaete carnosa HHB-10118-sp]|uniref:Glycoside hydrolase family 18 protein n=1 Tax=Phanerochaete carnosa (strain HHB-10118-sp) TaxID=650164 RepID=K5V3C0_PHACS|nr:glycoside hydrolase family 18 protein [Phanerochaete carnosa HHB-10118-sp]EKM57071.1 glycoside hydrolase family 18 protein [Phanerochaete carnosa HHB-10118-sp]
MRTISAFGVLSLLPISSIRAVPVCPGAPAAVATTWYTGWHAQYLPLEDISWDKWSSVSYAFAETTPDPSVISLQDSDAELLTRLVDMAHQNNVSALLTVGGWTGSRYFSTAVGSPENRTMFANALLGLVKQYDLNGIDLDWEYPNKQGMGCNIISEQDTPNFLAFLQELRSSPAGQGMTVSTATSIVPFASPDGTPAADVSSFANVLDYVTLMNYDVWGTWSPAVGPNSPLDDTCAPPQYQQGSAVSAVAAWTKAGFPADKIVIGVASYGHSYYVTPDNAFNGASSAGEAQPAGTTSIAAYPSFDKSQQPFGDSWDEDSPAGTDVCGNPAAGGPSGIFNFRGLVEKGYLDSNGTIVPGMGYRYDTCSQTPYLYDPKLSTMVSYDDAQSFAAKGRFIQQTGLLGFAMWEAVGDYEDVLLDAISGGMGIGEDSCQGVMSLGLPL